MGVLRKPPAEFESRHGRAWLNRLSSLMPGPLFFSSEEKTNTGTGWSTLHEVKLAASMFRRNGDSFNFIITGEWAANVNNKELTVEFGTDSGTSEIYTTGAAAFGGGVTRDFVLRGDIFRVDDDTERHSIRFASDSGLLRSDVLVGDSSVDLSANTFVVIKILAQGGATDDLKVNLLRIDHAPGILET